MARKKYVSLPKFYLSHSQMSLWLTNREKYKQFYFIGQRQNLGGKSIEFGKQAADALETGESTEDNFTDAVLDLFPKYEIRDELMELELKTKDGYIPLVAKPDTFNPKNLAFREYKTGLHPWDLYMAKNSKQMKFYSACIYIKYGYMPKDMWLDWAETERDVASGKIVFTGEIKSFEFKMSHAEVLSYIGLITRVAKEIQVAWILHNS